MRNLVRTRRLAAVLVLAITIVPAAARATSTRAIGGFGRYIVVLKPGTADALGVALREVTRLGGSIGYVYAHALRGYSAVLPNVAVALLRLDPSVAWIERDGLMRADAVEANPPWGLDRIDQRARPTDGAYHYTATGAGVTAYVIDTGIRFTHTEFGGRAVKGVDEVTPDGTAADCNGHGTHVAGTIGGATYGVAKAVKLVAVRVLDCSGSGSTSGVIAGVDWVTADHQAGAPAVANMSLGGSASPALDTAVRNSIADGIAYVVAAGNGNLLGFAANACNSSPARVAEAMTVSASDSTDAKASWANYGSCVDWFAPGVGIPSAWDTSDTATNTISGTSMATPHTTGVAAQYLQLHPATPPAQLRDALFSLTTKGVVTSSRTANDDLLYTDL